MITRKIRLFMAVLGLALVSCVALIACGGGGGSTSITSPETGDDELNVAAPSAGFNFGNPAGLVKQVDPGREISAAVAAAEFETGLPNNQVSANETNLVFTPMWNPSGDPPQNELAYCMYLFNIGDYTGPGSVSLAWQIDPVYAQSAWVGLGNQDTGTWDWTRCTSTYQFNVAEVDPYATPDGDVLLVVLMTYIYDATLSTVNFNAGDNEAPVAGLEVAAGGGSVAGPVDLDASGSTDSDGTIVSYEWDYDGDGTWDETTTQAVNSHTFAATGRRDLSVRVTDNSGDTDTATVNIGVYDEYESNDDGVYESSGITSDDVAVANTLPTVDFSGYSGNCGAGGYGDDREDFYRFSITETGWYSFTMYYSYADADLDMRLFEDIGGDYAELKYATSTSDNDYITYEFAYTGDFYWKVYAHTSGADADYTLELVKGLVPTASFTATPDEGDPPLEVSFDASASSDSDGSITLYEWDFDGDGTYDYSDGGTTASHTYTEAGGFHATLRVTDDDGLTATVSHTIAVYGDAPVADLQVKPSTGTAPLDITFDASGSTPVGGIQSYGFDWNNDGLRIDYYDEPITVMRFYTGGTFTVRLIVEDFQGQTDETTVEFTINSGVCSETEVNDTYQDADILPTLDFTGWTGAVGPVDDTEEFTADPEDWSKFTVPGAGDIRIYMVLTDELGDIDIALFDTDGVTELDHDAGLGDEEEITYHLNVGGTYYIQVYMYNHEQNKDWRGGYEFEVSFTAD